MEKQSQQRRDLLYVSRDTCQDDKEDNHMKMDLAVEDIEPNHWVAWMLSMPGCYSSAATEEAAIANAPQKIAQYVTWLLAHTNLSPAITEPIEVEVVETFHSFRCSTDPEYIVNAFFEDDRRPLGYWDVEIALKLLTWTRQDLSGVIQNIPQEKLTQSIAQEVRGSIAGILDHVAIAENWYYQQMGCGLEWVSLPADPLEKIEIVRVNTRQQLLNLMGDRRITTNCDELWSVRKVLRRTLWHERDHTQQIEQLSKAIR